MDIIERLIAHPRLALVAGLDAVTPAVHIWDCANGQPRPIGVLGVRSRLSVAWHPTDAVLAVATEAGVVRWTPDGTTTQPGSTHRCIAFSPGGRALWTDAGRLDLTTGELDAGPEWDTGLVVHPSGLVAAALRSDQGATLVLFTRYATDQPELRFRSRALIITADGYQAPVFNADGRRFAIRGNNYENSIDVYAFPSLEHVLAVPLGEPAAAWNAPEHDAWYEEYRSWSPHNLAFGTRPAVLYVGTPAGTLAAIDVERGELTEHPALDGSRVTALAALATGGLVVAGSRGELRLLADAACVTVPDAEGATALLGGTALMPDDADEPDELTDGVRGWTQDDLDTVTAAEPTDPPWLRIQAAMNTYRPQAREQSGADAAD
ncbi:hypothetical protein [Dactylosporangium sp. NPDC051541]|uniref:hypothetical protein n=1 Tax=Dactylosporangium sp. NPDC051541 TaxID=3363977 RepID=UPI00379B5E21